MLRSRSSLTSSDLDVSMQKVVHAGVLIATPLMCGCRFMRISYIQSLYVDDVVKSEFWLLHIFNKEV